MITCRIRYWQRPTWPDFEEFIKSLNNSGIGADTKKFQEAVHWVHHLFLAHVKITFLIHMREAENIDMLSSDNRDPRMPDHYFFINFTGNHLPDKLVFQHATDSTTERWLEEQLMLLTRPKIKCYDTDKAQWKYAPVVNASSRHAMMHDWQAKVRKIILDHVSWWRARELLVTTLTEVSPSRFVVCRRSEDRRAAI